MQSIATLGIDGGHGGEYDNNEGLYLSLPDLRRDPLHTSGALSNCTSPKLAEQDDFPDDGMEDDEHGGDSEESAAGSRWPRLYAASLRVMSGYIARNESWLPRYALPALCTEILCAILSCMLACGLRLVRGRLAGASPQSH